MLTAGTQCYALSEYSELKVIPNICDANTSTGVDGVNIYCPFTCDIPLVHVNTSVSFFHGLTDGILVSNPRPLMHGVFAIIDNWSDHAIIIG